MSAKKVRPFGTWPSPITPELVARGSRRFGTVQADAGAVYWSESRPEEGGRQTILRAARGKVEELLPSPFSARSRVHEYGGGEILVTRAATYFVNDKDQQIYRLVPGRSPEQLTHALGTRFADFTVDETRQRLIAVAEIHPRDKGRLHAMPRNLLVAIELSGKEGRISEIATVRDFYASPRLSPDGTQLAFLAWDLPDMPWDSATLYLARLHTDGRPQGAKKIAGGNGSAVFQPEWGPDGCLYFVWDDTGWGQLCRWQGKRIIRVHGSRRADLMRPQWVFGARSYAFHPAGQVGMVALSRGAPLLEVRDLKRGGVTRYPRLQVDITRIDDPVVHGRNFAALVSRPMAAPAIMRIARGGPAILSSPPPAEIEPRYISKGVVQEFRRPDRQPVYGIYYAPKNAQHRGPAGAAPPALVLVHGGPTSMTDAGLKMRVQFYTSRGFAVFDVNYSGSTGYGRAYRQRLDGQWGIADVADCAAAARYLARAGLAQETRIAISGGSAGGYTTLMALATTDVFAAGSSHYGVSDLALLLEHTHKFESGYLHRLMGTTPEKWKDVFAARSPINLIEGVRAPVILFQGLEDKVVPPEQSRLMVDQLKRRSVEVGYHEFAGEGHGFRKAETIIAVLEAELAFLRRVLS